MLRIDASSLDVPDRLRDAIVVHPGASSRARQWPPERWATVARAQTLAGRQVVITGDAGQRRLSLNVAREAGLDPGAVLAGRTLADVVTNTLSATILVLTGLLIGCGAATAVSAIIAATSPSYFGVILGVVATLVLLLRARAYANGSQAVALLTTGMLSGAGILLGWMTTQSPLGRLLWVFGVLVLIAAGALVTGVVFPNQRFSPSEPWPTTS